jgi:hypothetical protein
MFCDLRGFVSEEQRWMINYRIVGHAKQVWTSPARAESPPIPTLSCSSREGFAAVGTIL